MHHADGTGIYIGGRRISHLKSNLRALEIRLTDEQMARIESITEGKFQVGFPNNIIVSSIFLLPLITSFYCDIPLRSRALFLGDTEETRMSSCLTSHLQPEHSRWQPPRRQTFPLWPPGDGVVHHTLLASLHGFNPT